MSKRFVKVTTKGIVRHINGDRIIAVKIESDGSYTVQADSGDTWNTADADEQANLDAMLGADE